MNNFDKLRIECDKNIETYTKHLFYIVKLLNLHRKGIDILEKDDNELINIKKGLNYTGSIIIATLDLSVIIKNLISASSDWEKVFFIKNLYLIIHETLKNIKPDKNGSLSVIEENIKSYNLKDLKPRLEQCKENIEDFIKSKEYSHIKTVRNEIAAHMTKKINEYYDIILKLDGEQAGQIAVKFNSILIEILALSADLESRLTEKAEEKTLVSEKKVIEELKKLPNEYQDVIKNFLNTFSPLK